MSDKIGKISAIIRKEESRLLDEAETKLFNLKKQILDRIANNSESLDAYKTTLLIGLMALQNFVDDPEKMNETERGKFYLKYGEKINWLYSCLEENTILPEPKTKKEEVKYSEVD